MFETDFIGDIHGRLDLLLKLLDKLGYEKVQENSETYYMHPDKRQLHFIGDYIDRGDKSQEVLDMIISTAKFGNAICMLGNHELNYLNFYTQNTENDGNEFLREHSDKNLKQNKETRDSIGKDSKYLDFFKQLIIWDKSFDHRAIHAFWDVDACNYLFDYPNTIGELGYYFQKQSAKKGTKEFEMIETILKGPEIEVADDKAIIDSDGNKRNMIRLKWWDIDHINLLGADPEKYYYPVSERPIFFGHYSIDSEPYLLRDNVCCLDFGKHNKKRYLTAYRWNGERKLLKENLIWV